MWGPYWSSPSVGVLVGCIGSASPSSVRRFIRTTDGGANWTLTDLDPAGGGSPGAACWFDGTLVHVWFLVQTDGVLKYRTINVATGALSTLVTIATISSGLTALTGSILYGTKTQSGNLIVAGRIDTSTTDTSFGYVSTDGGGSWSSITSPAEATIEDGGLLLPANTGDGDDAALLYYDHSATTLSVKMWDHSAGTWTETTVLTSVAPGAGLAKAHLAASVLSNGLIVGAIWNAVDATTADLKTFTVNPTSIASPTVTAKTDVVTDSAESGLCAVTVNHQNGDIYVAYAVGGTYGSALDVKFKKSTDGMTTWGSQQTYSEGTAADVKLIAGANFIGASGGNVQFAWFEENNADIFVNLTNQVAIAAAGATLVAEIGAFAVTGYAAGLISQRYLACTSGAFALSGVSAGVTAARRLTAGTGEVSLTGNAAGLTRQRYLDAATEAFVVTGHDAGVRAVRQLVGAEGDFALTGYDAGMSRQFYVPGGTGSFALSGISAGLLASRSLTAGTGEFTLTGHDATLSRVFVLSADAGEFALDGIAASLLATRILAASEGVFALTGFDVTLSRGFLLAADTGVFTVTGSDADLVTSRRLNAAAGEFALEGSTAAIRALRYLAAETGSLDLTGHAAALTASRVLVCAVGDVALTGNAATLAAQRALVVTVGAFTITGEAAALVAGRIMIASLGAFVVTGRAATLSASAFAAPVFVTAFTNISPRVAFANISPRATSSPQSPRVTFANHSPRVQLDSLSPRVTFTKVEPS